MFADVDADIYVMADGDLTYDPKAAPAMVELLLAEQLDMVVGTRQHEAARTPIAAATSSGTGCSPACSPACSGAASATFSPATGCFRAAS